jgi:hypothetical protein
MTSGIKSLLARLRILLAFDARQHLPAALDGGFTEIILVLSRIKNYLTEVTRYASYSRRYNIG